MSRFKRTKNIMMPKKELIKEHEDLVKDLEGSKKQYEEQKAELKEIRGYDQGGLINPPKLSQDDFTQPGEMIPKDAGLADFIKYNLAHRTPEQDAQMGLASGGIRSIRDLPNIPSSLSNLEETPVVPTDPNTRIQANANEQALKDMITKQRMQEFQEATTPREFISEPELQADEAERQALSSKLRGGLPAPKPNYSITPEQIQENLRRLGRGSNF